jgi:hypothetical protein
MAVTKMRFYRPVGSAIADMWVLKKLGFARKRDCANGGYGSP